MPDVESAVISVVDVTLKDTGWYEVKDGEGRKFSTKRDSIGQDATGFKGRKAKVEFKTTTNEKDGRTYTNRYLESITAHEANGQEVISARADDGVSADWDLIGLRKTRCHLWGAFIQEAIPVCASFWSKGHSDSSETDLAWYIQKLGRDLIKAAEVDIYHRAPAGKDDDIPFG